MTANDVLKKLYRLGGYHSVLIPEFTWGNLRIDAIFIDFVDRWVRGFEIKVSRGNFKNDTKYALYSQFCSSLTIACPEGLIQPGEIEKPFGLLWAYDKPLNNSNREVEWKKRPGNFQKRNSLSWMWTYLKVMEKEFPRMFEELERVKRDKKYLSDRLEEELNKKEINNAN